LLFEWKRVNGLTGTSDVTITWDTGLGVVERGAVYRFRYYGDAKAVGGTVTPFEGVSGEFRLV
jgi:neutral ceramidase